jgi:hypothetical protein
MLTLTKLRSLDVTDQGTPRHLSAASGLARVADTLYVAADDDLHLGVFPATGAVPGRLIRLFSGALPSEKDARKARKPDLESIAVLPPFGRYASGALLGLGSGSTPNRRRGVLVGLDAHGAPEGTPQVVNLAGLFAVLERQFPAVNVEGATVAGGELLLLQRGNNRDPRNAIARLPLASVLDDLVAEAAIGATTPTAIAFAELGRCGGVPLCFTDASALPDGGIAFSAIAEDTDDAYHDGPCVGAAVGIVERDGRIRALERLERPLKIEGLDARVTGDAMKLLLVTDADDAAVPACLYGGTMAYPRSN